MDSDFCTRVEIALRSGGESMSAATAPYDLPAQRLLCGPLAIDIWACRSTSVQLVNSVHMWRSN
jgi:hypothetical protein